ncbi:hypothetical protein I6M96_12845 [Acinetobacter seifertii]|nr:hypothetical protein [Acinetobacter seifertii]MBJ8505882.1 hypothetical protein [Acinetobacter seifertii]
MSKALSGVIKDEKAKLAALLEKVKAIIGKIAALECGNLIPSLN